MKNLQENIDKWIENNKNASQRNFFEWLQGCEYCGSEIEYNGGSGRVYGAEWYTLSFNGEEEDFILTKEQVDQLQS